MLENYSTSKSNGWLALYPSKTERAKSLFTESGEDIVGGTEEELVLQFQKPMKRFSKYGMQFAHSYGKLLFYSVDGMANNGVFYTDSNGRQFVKRVRDHRPDYNPLNATIEEPVSSNYYPIGRFHRACMKVAFFF